MLDHFSKSHERDYGLLSDSIQIGSVVQDSINPDTQQ
jgi:hypothetical protein